MGFCAVSHLDLHSCCGETGGKTLNKIFVHKSKGFSSFGKVSTTALNLCFKHTHKNVYFFVSSLLLSFPFPSSYMQDKIDVNIERIKATVLLCYDYVYFHSPAQ